MTGTPSPTHVSMIGQMPVTPGTPSQALALHQELAEQGPMWVVYERPTDCPESFVARLWVTLPTLRATAFVLSAPTRVGLEALLPPDLVFLTRMPRDEPHIVGCWL